MSSNKPSELQKSINVLIGLLLTVSIVSHLVANRLVLLFDYPVIPATFTYMAVFSLSDMLASFNSRRFLVFVLLGEAAANLIWLAVVTSVNVAPEPEFFHLGQAYLDVFASVPKLYAANLGGGLIIGRKNWLFNVSHKGAETSAMLYSIIETAKANGLIPFDYINHCLEELAKSPTDLDSLLPWNVKLS